MIKFKCTTYILSVSIVEKSSMGIAGILIEKWDKVLAEFGKNW